MIIGNTFAQETVRKIIQSLDTDTKNKPVFLLLTGPENVGKTSFAQELMKEVLGIYYRQDFLFIQDMSSTLGKQHILKVGKQGATSDTMVFDDGSEYKDTTMREIISWLQYSPAGNQKAIVLENIERMNISSANAFLKAAEEPLPGRIIIATATHKSQITDTILSRAITIPFQRLTAAEMQTYCDMQGLVFVNDQMKDLFISMAMGRPGMLSHLFESIDDEVQPLFLDAIKSLQSKQSIQKQYSTLIKLQKMGYLQLFVDAWIQKISETNPEESQSRLSLKKHIRTNVSIDRLLLHTILS